MTQCILAMTRLTPHIVQTHVAFCPLEYRCQFKIFPDDVLGNMTPLRHCACEEPCYFSPTVTAQNESLVLTGLELIISFWSVFI